MLLAPEFSSLTSLDLEGNLDLEPFLEKVYLVPSIRLAHLNLARTYLLPEVVARIFSSPQIIHLRSLVLNCNPILKQLVIEELRDSLHTKNLKQLELKHMDFSNEDLMQLNEAKWLGDLQKLDLRCNPRLKIEKIILCEGKELSGIKAIRHLLMDNDSLNFLNRM